MQTLIATALPILLLALSMSADAFAAAWARARGWTALAGEALRTGLIFGSHRGDHAGDRLGAGQARSAAISRPSITGWRSGMLLVIGGKMIWDAFHRDEEEEKPQEPILLVLAVTAIGTSIDALAVGVTLALVSANIVVNALAIGAATFTMTTIGVMTGRFLGEKFGRYAEAAGGVVLIAIGVKILAGHTACLKLDSALRKRRPGAR